MTEQTPFHCFVGLVQGATQSRSLRCPDTDIERLFKLRQTYGPDMESLLDWLYDSCKPTRNVVQQYLERFGTDERALEERAQTMLLMGKRGTYFAECRFCYGAGCIACLGEAKRVVRERMAEKAAA